MFFGLVRDEKKAAARARAIRTVLVVEDEPLVAFDNERALSHAGYRIASTVDDYGQAIRVMDEGDVDLVIADVSLHGTRNGIDVARYARERGLPVLFVTGHCPIHASRLAVGCLAKPYHPRDLIGSIAVVDRMLRGRRATRLPPGLSLFTEAM
ncbi:response regulator [Sphingobium cloacae]|uniref:Response regulator n=1 Tax=Sphingobium cloacae TaxID=120107 RepID=A0A1E1F008_9SPHN|nr:response regulator [Sphingobium cloacae]BAV63791.1 response regulator [Sphingobium cloacae]